MSKKITAGLVAICMVLGMCTGFAGLLPCTVARAASAPLGDNLIKNGDFSQGTKDWYINWDRTSTISVGAQYINPNTGNNAVLLTTPSVSDIWSCLMQDVALPGGSPLPAGTYVASYWIKPDSTMMIPSADSTSPDGPFTGMLEFSSGSYFNFVPGQSLYTDSADGNLDGWVHVTAAMDYSGGYNGSLQMGVFQCDSLVWDGVSADYSASYYISDVSLQGYGINVSPPVYGANLIRNPGFTDGTNEWTGENGAGLTVEPGAGCTGGNAVYVACANAPNYQKCLRQSNITLPDGSNLPAGEYKLTFWVKSHFNSGSYDPSAGQAQVGVELSGGTYDFYWLRNAQDDTWMQAEYDFTLTSDLTGPLVISIHSWDDVSGKTFGDMEISDISLQGLGIATDVTPGPNWGANLIKNGIFADGTNNWSTFGSIAVSDANPNTGNNSLAVTLTNSGDAFSSDLSQVVTMPDGNSLPAGTYQLDFWIMAQSEGPVYFGTEKSGFGIDPTLPSVDTFYWYFQNTDLSQWTHVTCELVISQTQAVNNLNFFCITGGWAPVSYSVSDMVLRGDGIAVPNEPTLGNNIIRNSDFSQGLTYWWGEKNASIALDDGSGNGFINPNTGSAAVQVTNPDMGDMWNHLSQSVTLPDGSPLPAGNYVASFWIKPDLTHAADSTASGGPFAGIYDFSNFRDVVSGHSIYPDAGADAQGWIHLTQTVTYGTINGAIDFGVFQADSNFWQDTPPYDNYTGTYYISDVILQGYGINMPNLTPVTLNRSGTVIFPGLSVGYAPVSPVTVTAANTSSAPLTGLSVTLSGADAGSFTLDTGATSASLDGNASTTFKVAPNPGLTPNADNTPRTYNAQVSVTVGGNSNAISFFVSFTVYPTPPRNTFYVDCNTGSDTNPGTQVLPFRTIMHAVNLVQAGDTIIVEPGVYREDVEISTPGRSDAGITIRGDTSGGGEVVINGANVLSDNDTSAWTLVDSDKNIWSAVYPEYLPFNYTAGDEMSNTYSASRREMIIVNDSVYTTAASKAALVPGSIWCDGNTSNNSSYNSSTYANNTKPLCYVEFPAGTSPANSTIQYAAGRMQMYLLPPANYWTVEGFTFRYNSSAYNSGRCNFDSNFYTFRDCTCEWGNYIGFIVNGLNFTVDNIIARNCGGTGGSSFGDHSVMKNVQFLNNNWKYFNPYNGAGGIKIVLCNNSTFDNLTAIGNDGPGVWFDINNFHNIIENGTYSDNLYAGLMIENFSDYNVIQNNVSFANRGMGIFISASTNNSIINNTCYGNQTQGINVGCDYRNRDGNTRIFNNILAFNGGPQLQITAPTAADLVTNLLDGNVYWNPNPAATLLQMGTNSGIITQTASISTWKAKWAQLDSGRTTDIDANSIKADPLLTNPNSIDGWQLTANSPARKIGAATPDVNVFEIFAPYPSNPGGNGENLAQYLRPLYLNTTFSTYVTADRLGNPRPVSGCDAGAHQLSTASDGYVNPGAGLSDKRDDVTLGGNIIQNAGFDQGTSGLNNWGGYDYAALTVVPGGNPQTGSNALDVAPGPAPGTNNTSLWNGVMQKLSLPDGGALPAGDYELNFWFKSNLTAAQIAASGVNVDVILADAAVASSGTALAPVAVADGLWHSYTVDFTLGALDDPQNLRIFFLSGNAGGLSSGDFSLSDISLKGYGVNMPAVTSSAVGDLLGYWNFNNDALDVNGATVKDLSPNGNDGTMVGVPSLNFNMVQGPFGDPAIHFIMAGGQVIIPQSPSLEPTRQVSVNCWVNLDSYDAGGWPKVVWSGTDSGSPPGAYGIEFSPMAGSSPSKAPAGSAPDAHVATANSTVENGWGYGYAKAPYFLESNSPTGPIVGPSGYVALPTGGWRQLTATYDGQYVRLYIDGVLSCQNPATGDITGYEQAGLAIGGAVNKPNYLGSVDEVSVYGRALTPAEVLYLNANPVLDNSAIALSTGGSYAFPGADAGYSPVSPLTVTVNNVGSADATGLSAAISGLTAGDFTLDATGMASTLTGTGTTSFKVTPNAGLAPGTYTATVTVTGDKLISASTTVSFTVNGSAAGSIALDQSGTVVVPQELIGYTGAIPKVVTVTGAGSVSNLWTALEGANADSFIVTQPSVQNLSDGETASFTVAPKDGLAAGTYTAVVYARGDNGATAGFVISFTVSAQSQGVFTCDVKSMLAKVAKLQKIPYAWTGAASLTFTSSNAAVCGVTGDGTLVPLKAGIAVITITKPDGAKYIFAVTVTV